MASNWGLTEFQNETANILSIFLPEDPTFQSQNSIYEYALFTHNEALEDRCIRYLAWNCEALISSPAWKNLSFSLVKALLSRSDLVVSSERAILNGLEKWAAAQENTTIPQDLLKLIRFPMIPADDLYTLNSPQYQASKLQGFQFNALPYMTLLNDLIEDQNSYTPRIYTGRPWSFTFNYYEVEALKVLGSPDVCEQISRNLSSDFHTPVHNSAYFNLQQIHWKTGVYFTDAECFSKNATCSSLPTVSLEKVNHDLNGEIAQHIRYNNVVVIECEGTYVVHVEEFKAGYDESFEVPSRSAKELYLCQSNMLSFQVVIRPHYIRN